MDFDVRTIVLPTVLAQGVSKLYKRMLRMDTVSFPRTPTFGDLAQVVEEDIYSSARDAEESVAPLSARELIAALKRIDPFTLVCDACGEIPLSVVGGVVIDPPPAGALCPFCQAGELGITPMLLRRVNWLTGELMDPGIEEDIRSRPGVRIPIVDERIRAWVRRVDTKLDQDLAQAGLPIYALLAYLHLKRKLFADEVPNVVELLRNPHDCFYTQEEWLRDIQAALRYRDAREMRNTPREYLVDGRARREFWPLKMGDRTYLIEGHLGHGDKGNVYRARWDHDPTELVVIKVLVAAEDADLFDREARMLSRVRHLDDVDSEFFLQFVPHVMATGEAQFPDGTRRKAMVYRNRHQFDWTLGDITHAYGTTLDPRHVVWMMNRVTEVLRWLHGKGLVHGAILPEHVLVKPQIHRVQLLDWSYAARSGESLTAVSDISRDFYPDDLLSGAALDPKHDLAMACRCMLFLLGADPRTGKGAMKLGPDGQAITPLTQVLFDHARLDGSHPSAEDVASFKETFSRVARNLYGPPAWIPFPMPAR